MLYNISIFYFNLFFFFHRSMTVNKVLDALEKYQESEGSDEENSTNVIKEK